MDIKAIAKQYGQHAAEKRLRNLEGQVDVALLEDLLEAQAFEVLTFAVPHILSDHKASPENN